MTSWWPLKQLDRSVSTPYRGEAGGMRWRVDAVVHTALSLINEQSQPGKGGMAVTSHDLMVAAKTAGQKC